MSNAARCVIKHLGKNSPISAYRADMSGDVDELVAGGMERDAAWLQVIDAKLSDLGAEKLRIEQSVADAYAKTAAGKKAATAAAANDPAPADSTQDAKPGTEIDPLDAELQDALGKLGDVLGDVFGAKLNVTGPQYSAADLLPALSKVVELLVRKGFKSFAQATAKAAQVMRANAATAPHVDAISARQWKAAYNAIADGHEGTDTEDALAALTADDVKAMVTGKPEAKASEVKPDAPAADGAKTGPDAPQKPTKDDTQAQEAANDTQGNGADDAEPLDPQLPAGNPELAKDVAPETSASVRGTDADGNGHADSGRVAARTGMGRGKKPVLSGAPAEVRPVSRSPVAGDADAQNQLFGDAPANFEISDKDGIGQGTKGQKLRANMEAIRTLRRIQADNRNATPDEQAVMAKFVGWGGLRELIDPSTTGKQWLDARAELLGTNGQPPLLVGGDKGSEWIALQRSTTAAHYTAPEIVKSMWDVVRHFGFGGGRVLEPTSGIGNFIGLQPRDLAASSEWHGAELDMITGQLAKLIYPEAAIAAGIGFQDVPFAKGAFDLAIGNPPFGSLPLKSSVAAYKDLPEMKIHNFIIAKTGEHLRPGGVMAMVVTHRFLDTANPEAREHLAKDFKFLGAFRLPNDAFLKNAGTEVTTDVIFLQKLHAGEKATDLNKRWLDTEGRITVDGQDMRVNRYYEKNPGNILGRSAMDGTMYAGRKGKGEGDEYTVHSDGRDLNQAIASLLENEWADLKDVAKPTSNDASVAAVMIQQSDLPVGGVMLDGAGKLLRREMDDEGGNAVVVEVTPETIWKDDGEKWRAVKDAADALKTSTDKPKAADALRKAAVGVAYNGKGEKRPKPTGAEQAVYDIVDDATAPGFQWEHDAQLDKITVALDRRRLGAGGYASLKGMIVLRNTVLQLIEAERADKAADMTVLRDRLNAEYDAFVAQHGYISDPDNAKLLDGDVGVESGLESGYRHKSAKAKSSANKADIFTKRVNYPYREITSAKDASDGLQISLSERGKLDIPYIAKLTGQSSMDVINELSTGDAPLIFLDPATGEYTDADAYLSGNVKAKLQRAKAEGLKANVRALEAVQPAPKTKANVRPSIRGAWMPEGVFQDFLAELGAKAPKVTIIPSQGMILASSAGTKDTEFGTQFKNPNKDVVDIFNAASSGKPITIWTKDSSGNQVKSEGPTKEVNLLVERMSKVFNEWAWSNDERIQSVVDAFNEKMNTHVARKFDGNKYLKPVGASPSIELRTTQKNAAWRIVQAQTTLLDHVVGAGKTFTVITGAMQRRRLGLSRKPMIVVPNHLVTQWARDFYALYPGAKILAATPDDFALVKRRRLFSRIATGNFDAVIIGHSSLSFIKTPAADQEMVINEQIKDLQDVLNELKAKKESGRTLTQIQEKLAKYEGKLKDLQSLRTDEIGVDLETMGVDYLAVDEMHEFKNLEYSTAGERVVGMNDPKGSKKAFDLYLKIRGLLARGGAVTGATGTPVSNSLVELYTMLKYLAHQDLVDRSQLNFDAWSGAYARTETKLEYTATQKLKPRRVLAGLNNLSALKQLYEQFADVISMADLKRIYAEDVRAKNAKDKGDRREGFPVPKVKSGGRVLDAGPITPQQAAYMDYLVARMQGIEAHKRDKTYAKIDNPLYVLTDARKMSLDIRIADPQAPRDENGKVMRAAANILDTYKLWDKDRGTQLVFCDLSTPSKNAAKEARTLVKESVVKLFGDGADGKRVAATVKALPTFVEQWRYIETLANEVAEAPGTDPEVADNMMAYLGSLEDVDATMTTADIGFSVYDDLKQVLVERGIPEPEIAFIHDFHTPEQKAKLFSEVNEGAIRVLLGSSAKMGAGTNAQRRLVALHHMDAPWRPSDVEQREGRIIRQGNMLFERDPDGFEVDIRAYSTNGTSDAVMWQVLERKARAIEEFRNAGLDQTDEEGSDSNQYAEFMAQSTGNPVFRLKLEAERAVDTLDTDSRGALMAKSQATRFLETYDRELAAARASIEYAKQADVSEVTVGRESGTAQEFEAAISAARAKHEKDYADYLGKKAEADKALAAWKELTELERGDKPTMPTAPSMPGLLSKQIQAASGYARAIKEALTRGTAAAERGYEFTLGNMRMRVRKSMFGDNWALDAWNGAGFESVAHTESKTAEDSSVLARALTPDAMLAMAKAMAPEAKRRETSLLEQHGTKKKLADKQIDTSKLEDAKRAMEWLQRQVGFAEQQADIKRGERPNQYILGDKKRSLAQAKTELGDTNPVEFNGEVFKRTGFSSEIYFQATGEDGREVMLRMPMNASRSEREVESVIEKPKSVEFSGLMKSAAERAKIEPMFSRSKAVSRPMVTVELEEGGLPVYLTDKVRLEFPQITQRLDVIEANGEQVVNYPIMSATGFDVLGYVELLVKDGKAKALLDIEVDKQGRKAGVGRDVIEALLAAVDTLDISNIVPEARGFWEKMGIPPQNVEGAYDGALTWKTYASAQNPGAESRAAGSSQAARESTAARAEGQGAGPAQKAQSPAAIQRRQAVEALAARITARWKNAPEVVVVSSMSDPLVPRSVRSDDASQLSQGAQGVPEGFFHGGKVYLVAPQLGGDADVVRVLFHEALGHYGLRGTFGPELGTILDRLAVLNAGKVRDKAKQYGLDYDKPSDRRMAAEEVLAEMAQRSPNIGWVKKAVAAIRSWLREHVPGFGKMAMSDAEIVRSFLLPARAFVQRGDGKTSAAPAVAFSRGKSLARELQERGEPIASYNELQKLWSNGARIFYGHDMAEEAPLEAKSINDLRGYTLDQMLALPPEKAAFSRSSIADAVTNFSQADARNAFLDAVTTHGSTNLWGRTVGTQYHKAQTHPRTFGRVFDAVQDYIKDTSVFANRAADLAPSLLPKLDTYKDLTKGGLLRHGADHKDTAKAGEAIFRGTLDKVLYDDAALRSKFGLNDAQIGLYKEFRAAVDQSLEGLGKTEMLRIAGAAGLAVRADVLAAPTARDAGAILAEHLEGDEALAAEITQKVERIEQLKAEGYAPLMRFGKHTLTVTGKDGSVEFFGMYESVRDANKAARLLKADPEMAGLSFTQGVMSEQGHKLFGGLSLDSLELFAQTIEQQDNPVYQEYLKLAVSNRSAMKRMIERKGVAGYSDDVARVLASFVTSNARMSAGHLHLTDAKAAAEAIPKEQGDLRDDAIKLVDYVTNPAEEAAAVRGLLFTTYIGGSVASALVNMTQPITMTLPYLTQHGGALKAGKRLTAAMAMVASGKVSGDLAAALKRAEDDGIVSPQEIHHLQAQAMNSLGQNPVLKKVAFIWGSMFSLAEQFNRRVSFVAAYHTAQQEGIANPFAFAEKAVIETQGLYNKGNKANLARGAVGATVMTFKQFSTHYLEFLTRMWKSGPEGKKAVAVALALLLLMGGAGGLPFADDLDDLIDTLGQAMGHDTNSKRWKRQFIAKTLGLGDAAAEVAARGLTALPGVPLDLSLRMGMGNLLPATGLFLRSNTDTAKQLLEVAGAAGGLASSVKDGVTKALGGDVAGGAMGAMPLAVQNMLKAIQMAQTGEYRNAKGAKVMGVDGVDALMKGIGFQPSEVARESAKVGETMRSIQLAKNVEGEIAGKWAQALADGDTAGAAKARKELADWNEANPTARIKITIPQVLARVKALKSSRAERTAKAAPKEMRAQVRETLH